MASKAHSTRTTSIWEKKRRKSLGKKPNLVLYVYFNSVGENCPLDCFPGVKESPFCLKLGCGVDEQEVTMTIGDLSVKKQNKTKVGLI